MTEATIPRWLKYDMAHREEKKAYCLPIAGALEIRSAIKAGGKGCGIDNWSKEELAKQPNESFEALAFVLDAVECEGGFPLELRGALEILQSKGKGPEILDQRNLGLLPRIYRVWAALRQPIVQAWAREHIGDWSWGNCRGRGPMNQ